MIESKVMISSTGHDGPMGASGVKRLARLGMVNPALPGMGALDMNSAEDAIVDRTREVAPGMVLCGMEVSEYVLFLDFFFGGGEEGGYITMDMMIQTSCISF